MAAPAPMRASDQDRHEAVLALSDQFAEGRLDHDEFERRQARAQEAVFLHDLDPLFTDLPGRVAPASRAPQGLPVARRGRAPHPVAMALAAVLSMAATLAMVGLTVGAVATGHLVWLLVPLLAFVATRRARRHAHP